jgi:TRAP-type C4-dicarboxylate transport system permease small subunit
MQPTAASFANSLAGRLRAAALAFALWGGWALLANWSSDPQHALIAGLLQGTASALMTLVMAIAAKALFYRLPEGAARLLLPAVLIVSASFTLLYLVHSWHQTHALWQTIVPPTSLAFIYCLFLCLRLQREQLCNEAP